MPPAATLTIGVIGPGSELPSSVLESATAVGALIARAGHVLVCGGLGGVMEAAAKGASAEGGIVVGLLPGRDRSAANPYNTVALPTGLGELRNGLLVRSSDAIISVGGSWGTLSEIALAVRTGVPVVTLDGWELPADGPLPAATPKDAVEHAITLAAGRRPS